MPSSMCAGGFVVLELMVMVEERPSGDITWDAINGDRWTETAGWPAARAYTNGGPKSCEGDARRPLHGLGGGAAGLRCLLLLLAWVIFTGMDIRNACCGGRSPVPGGACVIPGILVVWGAANLRQDRGVPRDAADGAGAEGRG